MHAGLVCQIFLQVWVHSALVICHQTFFIPNRLFASQVKVLIEFGGWVKQIIGLPIDPLKLLHDGPLQCRSDCPACVKHLSSPVVFPLESGHALLKIDHGVRVMNLLRLFFVLNIVWLFGAVTLWFSSHLNVVIFLFALNWFLRAAHLLADQRSLGAFNLETLVTDVDGTSVNSHDSQINVLVWNVLETRRSSLHGRIDFTWMLGAPLVGHVESAESHFLTRIYVELFSGIGGRNRFGARHLLFIDVSNRKLLD